MMEVNNTYLITYATGVRLINLPPYIVDKLSKIYLLSSICDVSCIHWPIMPAAVRVFLCLFLSSLSSCHGKATEALYMRRIRTRLGVALCKKSF